MPARILWPADAISIHTFILKGGVLLAALDAPRPTRDIDFAVRVFETSAEKSFVGGTNHCRYTPVTTAAGEATQKFLSFFA